MGTLSLLLQLSVNREQVSDIPQAASVDNVPLIVRENHP